MQAIDKKSIRIRPYVEEDHDQVIQMLLQGFTTIDYPIFRRKAKQTSTLLSILFKSIIYTSLIELALVAYSSSSTSPSSFTGTSQEYLRSFSEMFTKPESAQSLILQFLQPSFLVVWALVSLTVAATTLVQTYQWALASNAEYVEGCFKDDLGDIQGYYQSQVSTNGKENRSQYWVACLDSHPQLVMGCISLDDNYGHTEHLRKKHLAQGGTDETFTAPKEADAELRRLSVHINYRRLGISTMLMDKLVEHAKENGFRRVVFSTTYFQKAALHGYIRYGFEKEKTAQYGDIVKLWFGAMNLYAGEEEKEEQRKKQDAMLQDIESY
ncbi:hypothetical protein EDD21DRAFT_390547 [Dissophora ornata]|nr:hypothetical protein EDD21DRAFT_390547 [Dissophora ornata]